MQNEKGWSSHAGFDGEAFTEGLIPSIEHGMRGSLNNPRYGEAAHMIEFTQEWANAYARQLLKQRL